VNQVDIENRLEEICRDRIGIPVDAADEDLIEAGVLDSLVIVQLLMAIEHEFQVKIPAETLDIDRLRTTRSMGAFIAELRQ
jgi:acyl carrier protein